MKSDDSKEFATEVKAELRSMKVPSKNVVRRKANSRGRDGTDDKPQKPRGTKFIWRLIAGLLGAGVALSAQAVVFRENLVALLNNITTGSDGFSYMQYPPAMGILLGAAVVCGIITGLMDRSALRSLFLGAGWGALIVVGLLIFRTLQPETIEKWPLSVRMAEVTINPVMFKQVCLFEAEKTGAEEIEEKLQTEVSEANAALQKAQEELPAKIEAAEKRGSKAKADELLPIIESKDREITALREELNKTQSRVKELKATLEEQPSEPSLIPAQ